ncbi:CAP-Gly domain-containing linker protein 4-like isoform X2 [Artemia franciscana]|uniref:CAP-Gly domain-containing protein n=1 Tax=Artemia franciscana TaxID=6661 RepID=A0AA88I2B8_ARTSF|nr:hypothetical protein QYM36_005950 [Artemia franciscana]
MGEMPNFSSTKPKIHPPIEAPLCADCRKMDLSFFDPECNGCRSLVSSSTTSVSEVFAILRQWTRQVQCKIDLFVHEFLSKEANVNDRDGLTDMTILHYVCKAGAPGVGDPELSAEVARRLLDLGADIRARCRWSHMTAVHFATFFNSARTLRWLIESDPDIDIDDPCHEYDNGSALHMAAGSLSLESARVLMEYGANPSLKDDLGRTPFDCIPDPTTVDLLPEAESTIQELFELLSIRAYSPPGRSQTQMVNNETIGGRAILKAMGLRIGDRVMLNGCKSGILRYCGTTDFALGVWAGIELDTAEGKHNGTVNEVTYFKCSSDRGIFAPVNRISRICGTQTVHASKRSRPTSNGSSTERPYQSSSSVCYEFSPGDRVTVKLVASDRHCTGTIRYAGSVSFSSGVWFGVELDSFDGRNDGTVQGVRYFSCQQGRGVFAPASKLEILKEDASPYSSLPSHASRNDTISSLSSKSGSADDAKPLRRSLSTRYRNEKLKESEFDEKAPLSRSGSVRVVQKPKMEPPAWQNVQPEPLSRTASSRKKKDEKWLAVGMNVLYQHEVGIIKYIGKVQFADGLWLGLEMRNERGKHDGVVKDVRYFTCKQGRGLFVRPSAVTVRGINGALLVKESKE